MRFAHIADTHIRNLKYHTEYRTVFNKIYETLKQEQVDYIIHLAGANIADKRWTKNRKKTILDSRQKPAHLIYSKIFFQTCIPKAVKN